MQDTFERALNWVLDDEERGFAGPPQIDQPTHSGITLIALKEFLTPTADLYMLESLTEEEITIVYQAIWKRIGANGMMTGLDYLAFDCAVNPGISWASHQMQQVAGVIQDGIVGPRTLGSLSNRIKSTTIFPILREITVARLYRYAERSDTKYVRGLFNRAVKVHQRALFLSVGLKGLMM